MQPHSEEAVAEFLDPTIRISADDLEDQRWDSVAMSRLGRALKGGGDWLFCYDFDSRSYKLVPVPRDRTGFGVWLAKSVEYTLRIGILIDRHQLRIYLGRLGVIVFGRRDLDILTPKNYAS